MSPLAYVPLLLGMAVSDRVGTVLVLGEREGIRAHEFSDINGADKSPAQLSTLAEPFAECLRKSNAEKHEMLKSQHDGERDAAIKERHKEIHSERSIARADDMNRRLNKFQEELNKDVAKCEAEALTKYEEAWTEKSWVGQKLATKLENGAAVCKEDDACKACKATVTSDIEAARTRTMESTASAHDEMLETAKAAAETSAQDEYATKYEKASVGFEQDSLTQCCFGSWVESLADTVQAGSADHVHKLCAVQAYNSTEEREAASELVYGTGCNDAVDTDPEDTYAGMVTTHTTCTPRQQSHAACITDLAKKCDFNAIVCANVFTAEDSVCKGSATCKASFAKARKMFPCTNA